MRLCILFTSYKDDVRCFVLAGNQTREFHPTGSNLPSVGCGSNGKSVCRSLLFKYFLGVRHPVASMGIGSGFSVQFSKLGYNKLDLCLSAQAYMNIFMGSLSQIHFIVSGISHFLGLPFSALNL